MIKKLIFNKTKNASVCFFIYMYMSALKSNVAVISMETNRGIFFSFFSIFFHTDHNKYTMKWLGWKMSKTIFRPAYNIQMPI